MFDPRRRDKKKDAMSERDLITYPTWERYTVLSHVVATLTIKERRKIFQLVKNVSDHQHVFLPHYGFTFAEFAVWYTLGENKRRIKSR